MLPQILCSALEKIIAKTMAMNLSGDGSLLSLEQRSLAVSLDELPFTLIFSVSNKEILVGSVPEGELPNPDCHIKSSLKTLKKLKEEQQLTALIKQGELDIDGDIKVAQQFANIAENLEIDWQTELAKHIGDIATYKLVQLVSGLGSKLNFFGKTVQADASEWLVHEKKWVVPYQQVNQFGQQVEQVSNAVNQLSQRVEHLLKKQRDKKAV